MEPFFIEADIFEDNKPVQLFVLSDLVNETESQFRVEYDGILLATLTMDDETMDWKDLSGKLDHDTVLKIGDKIDSYYQ